MTQKNSTIGEGPRTPNLREVAPGSWWETPEVFASVGDQEVLLGLQANVQVPGKDVVFHHIRWTDSRTTPALPSILQALNAQAPGLTGPAIAEFLLKIADRHPLVEPYGDELVGSDGQVVRRRLLPGTQVFTEAGMQRLSPLKEVPSKVSMAHVIRALANGQFKNLRCDLDSHDLGPYPPSEGPIVDARGFLRRLVERDRNSGWGAGQDRQNPKLIRVNQHHFNCNSFELVL